MKKFPYYPIFLDVEDRGVTIIGGGNVCARKAETMLRYGARVTVVAPEISDEIERLARYGSIAIKRKAYDASDLDGSLGRLPDGNQPDGSRATRRTTPNPARLSPADA